MQYALLLTLIVPLVTFPLVYLTGKKSAKAAAMLVVFIAIAEILILLTTVSLILDSAGHKYVETYLWIPMLSESLTLFIDGIGLSMALVTLILVIAAAIFSIDYLEKNKNPALFFALLTLLASGLVGVFITSNLLLFYFCWELMLVPTFFIIGGWGYKDPYKAAFKFFIFTHAGAVFVLLGIGAVFMVTGDLDMFSASAALMTAEPEVVKWILISFTAGFAVKMAVVPVHMWLPDAHSEAPAPMSALLSGVIISAGAYAILRVSLGTVFPSFMGTEFGNQFLYGLSIFGVISAFFGSFIALVETDIKRIIAYSSIAHMGYVLFGLSLFPFQAAMTGTVLHLVNHAVSKGLLFLTAGSIMKQLEIRDIREMGGIAGQMPYTATSSTAAALSIAGIPPFACFISEFFIFVGAFQAINNDAFFLIPTIFLLIATVLSLAYALRFVGHIFLGAPKIARVEKVPFLMKLVMIILMILVVLFGIWPTFFIDIISTANYIL